MENRSEEDYKLSQGTYGPEKHQEGLGKPDLWEVDQETEDGQAELVVGLEEPSELSMTVGEGDTSLVFLNGKDIFSLKTEELKAELDKRGLKKSGNKCTLVERLRAAMISEHISQTFENDHKHSQVKEKPIKTNSHIQDQEIYSFIETKLREVCLHEIEKLKSEASSSYANETISSLQKENDTLKQRLQELESRHTSMKQEATTLIDENKSLMTAIMLLNNELQTVLKADDMRCSRPNERPDKKEWQVVGAKKKKEKTKTRERNPEQYENEDVVNHPNDNNSSSQAPRQSTSNSAQSTDQKPCVIIAGDSMLKFINGRKLSSQISNQSLTYVKAFPGATVEDMSDYIMPSLRRKPEEVILHVGTNNLKSSEPREIAEGIVNLGLKIQNHSPDCKITISSLISRSDQTLNGKIKDVNKIVNQFAKQHAWRTIPHSNIKNEHLNASGLHLNVQGTKLLAKNLISHLRNS
ncbi:hypothetical protein ABFA07_020349 [Porites harrisoni]